MTEILTESFCERCGTRYTFETARPRSSRIGRAKTFTKGLRNYVLSDDSFSEAMADARGEQELAATNLQLDAFHRTFNFCLDCRQYTCGNCWNSEERRCLSCAPLPDMAPVELDTETSEAIAGRLAAIAATPEAPAPTPPELVIGISAWPSSDLPSRPETLEEAPVDALPALEPIAAPEPEPIALDHEASLPPPIPDAMPEASPAASTPDTPVPEAAALQAIDTVETAAAVESAFLDTAPAESIERAEGVRSAALAALAPEPQALDTAAAADTAPAHLRGLVPGQSLEDAIAAYEAAQLVEDAASIRPDETAAVVAPAVEPSPTHTTPAEMPIDAIAEVEAPAPAIQLAPEAEAAPVVETLDEEPEAEVVAAASTIALEAPAPAAIEAGLPVAEVADVAAVEPEPAAAMVAEAAAVVTEPMPEAAVSPAAAEAEPVAVEVADAVAVDREAAAVAPAEALAVEHEPAAAVATQVPAAEVEPGAPAATPVPAAEVEPAAPAADTESAPSGQAEPLLEAEQVASSVEPEPATEAATAAATAAAGFATQPDRGPAGAEPLPPAAPVILVPAGDSSPTPRTAEPIAATAQPAAPAAPAADSSAWLAVAPDDGTTPAWPAPPNWPTQPRMPMTGTLAGRKLLPPEDVVDVWSASAREVLQGGPLGRPGSGSGPSTAVTPQPCVGCGLPLSANARFCRRCGARQG